MPKQVVRNALVGGIAVLWMGCATPMRNLALDHLNNAEMAYLVSHTAGDQKAAERFARQIADSHLRERVAARPGPNATLPAWRHYVATLEQPIALSLRAADVTNHPDIQKLSAQDREALREKLPSTTVSGAQASPDWRAALAAAQAETKIREDKLLALGRAADVAQVGARSQSGAQQVLRGLEAAQLYDLAVRLDPTAISLLTKQRNAWFATARDAAALAGRADLDRQAVPDDQAYAQILHQSLLAIESFHVACTNHAVAQQAWESIAGTMADAGSELANRLGATGAVVVRQLASNAAGHWRGYHYVSRLLEAHARLAKVSQPAYEELEQALVSAYAEVCPLGFNAYKDLAKENSGFGGNLGLSLIFSRMAQEMAEYANARGRGDIITKQALVSLEESRELYQAKLRDALTRGLVIRRVSRPSDSSASDELGVMLRNAVDEITRPVPGSIIFGVKVEEATSTTTANEKNYNVDIAILKLDVDPQLRTKVGGAPVIKIGQDVHVENNPAHPKFRKVPRSNKHDYYWHPNMPPATEKELDRPPRQRYEQEVWYYDETIETVKLTAHLVLDATCTRGLEKFQFAQDFAGNSALPEITLTSQSKTYGEAKPLNERRISYAEPVIDASQPDVPDTLSSGSQIQDAMLRVALEGLTNWLTRGLASYPVSEMARHADVAMKQGKQTEAADTLGKCLEYCWQLALGANATNGDLRAKAWASQRTILTRRLQELDEQVWKAAALAPELRQTVTNIWEESVEAALATLSVD